MSSEFRKKSIKPVIDRAGRLPHRIPPAALPEKPVLAYTRPMRAQFVLLVLLTAGWTSAADPAAQALLDADKAFARDAAARGIEGWMSWFADDARLLSKTAVLEGKPALREVYARWFAQKDFSVQWAPLHAEASADGSLGYTYGRATVSYRDEKGELHTETSRYTTVWRRMADGSYKVIYDIGS
jgi:ketosteroid isomerase-like protein